MTEELKTAWALIAEHGFGVKLTKTGWYNCEYICFSDNDWIDEKGQQLEFTTLFGKEYWKLYKPEPKKITWYAPSITWDHQHSAPQICGLYCYKSKEECLEEISKHDLKIKVLEWKTFEAPETWEQCE